ncbi:hypothetical protein [Gemella sanguinis]
MEKNKQSLQLARTSLTITLFIWFLALTIFLPYIFILFDVLLLYLIPTILNIIISYEKRYEQDDFFGMILITLLSYIIFGLIITFIEPFLFYIFAIFFIPQTIFLIRAYLTFKKTDQNN